MRVLFATKEHLPTVGGAQLTAHHLARALAARGHEVAVLAPETEVAQRSADLGYGVTTAPDPAAALRALLGGARRDVVVVHACAGNRAQWAVAEQVAGAGVPAVLYVHDAETADRLPERAAQRATVAAVSSFVARRLDERGIAAEVVLPVVDAGDYSVPTTRRRALFVNPVREKGLDTALTLAAIQQEVEFEWVLCWEVGPGGRDYLRWEAERLGNVALREPVQSPRALYGEARAVLVPSTCDEAYGRVAREALMSGIPVLASDVGGLAESVGDGGLMLAPDATPEDWADALWPLWYHDGSTYAHHVERAEREAATGATSSAAVGQRFERLLEAAL